MAIITLVPQDATRGGLTTTYTAAGASPLLNTTDTFIFQNTGRELVLFQKTGAGACTVTFDTPGTVDGLAIAQRVVTVPAGTGDAIATTAVVAVGPFPPNDYNGAGTSLLSGFTLSEVTGLAVRILRLP